ncbi:hypothetical protein VPHD148_0248 [Vibrio phage D148]
MTTPKIGNINTTMNTAHRVSMTADVVGSRTVSISAWGTDRAECIRKLRKVFHKVANEMLAEDKRNEEWDRKSKIAVAKAKESRRKARIEVQKHEAARKARVARENATQMDHESAYRRAKAMTPAKPNAVQSETVAPSAGRYITVNGVVEFV